MITNRPSSGEFVNSLSIQEMQKAIDSAIEDGFIVKLDRQYNGLDLYKSNYVPNKSNGHGQMTINKRKVLVHHVWFRLQNNGLHIDPNLHISHMDAEPEVLRLIMETRDMNESRKYCHLFKWYKIINNESRIRCPHIEDPCSGPL